MIYNNITIAVKNINNFPNRPTIIFLHDSFGCIELWKDFPQKLGELTQCNVLVYDRQGYGKSSPMQTIERDKFYQERETDILNDLFNKWNINKAILFGHSDGGTIALIAAAKYPQKIIGIITEGAHIFIEQRTVEGIKDAIVAYQNGFLKAKLEKYHGDKTNDVFWAWAKTWDKEEFRTWNIEYLLPLIKCPTLVIQGENDEYGTVRQVDRIVELTSGTSEKFIVQNSKHSPHKEFQELILKKTAEFINQL